MSACSDIVLLFTVINNNFGHSYQDCWYFGLVEEWLMNHSEVISIIKDATHYHLFQHVLQKIHPNKTNERNERGSYSKRNVYRSAPVDFTKLFQTNLRT